MGLFYISEEASAESATADKPLVLLAAGELDFHATPRLREQIATQIDAGRHHLVIDVSEVTFIDSTAIGALVGAASRLRQAGGGSVAVVCDDANEKVRRIFDIAGVENAIPLYLSREHALSALAAAV
jgi:anti-sigma B factor antagonist